jgi:diguanylate cyclase
MVGVVFATVIMSLITVFFSQEYTLISNALNLFIHTIFFLIYPWISVLFFYYTLFVIYEDKEKSIFRTQVYSSAFIIIYSFLVLLNSQYGFMFTIDQVNGYQAHNFEILIFGVAYIYMILMLIYIELNRHIIERAQRLILISYVFITSLFVTIQYFYPSLLLVGTSAGLSILIMYLYIQGRELVSDYVTRLPNRVAYERIVKYRLRMKKNLCTVVVSLKDFKNINNMYGQHNGDKLLIELARYFVGLVGRVNVYRYSGDKFALLYFTENVNSQSLITKIYERFKLSWNVYDSKIYLDTGILHVNISDHVQNEFETVSLIDYLNDRMKSLNQHAPIYSTSDSIHELNRKSIVNEYIKKALIEDKFEIVVQPIYSVEKKQYTQGEALLRLNHPSIGSISPIELIPLAEESGQIIELGLWVLKRSLQFLKECDDQGIELDMISINFSVVQINDANLIEDVKSVVNEYPMYVHKIAIEITESIFIADYQRIIEQMFGISRLGINFYLDDFGTGYSNILNVIKLPLSVIKIDKTLIYESIHNESNKKLVSGLCDAFRDSGMKILAEGIETDEQYQIIKEMNIDYIQGFLFSKPLSIEDALDFFSKHKV